MLQGLQTLKSMSTVYGRVRSTFALEEDVSLAQVSQEKHVCTRVCVCVCVCVSAHVLVHVIVLEPLS